MLSVIRYLSHCGEFVIQIEFHFIGFYSLIHPQSSTLNATIFYLCHVFLKCINVNYGLVYRVKLSTLLRIKRGYAAWLLLYLFIAPCTLQTCPDEPAQALFWKKRKALGGGCLLDGVQVKCTVTTNLFLLLLYSGSLLCVFIITYSIFFVASVSTFYVCCFYPSPSLDVNQLKKHVEMQQPHLVLEIDVFVLVDKKEQTMQSHQIYICSIHRSWQISAFTQQQPHKHGIFITNNFKKLVGGTTSTTHTALSISAVQWQQAVFPSAGGGEKQFEMLLHRGKQ